VAKEFHYLRFALRCRYFRELCEKGVAYFTDRFGPLNETPYAGPNRIQAEVLAVFQAEQHDFFLNVARDLVLRSHYDSIHGQHWMRCHVCTASALWKEIRPVRDAT
jgi:hypothetical protein